MQLSIGGPPGIFLHDHRISACRHHTAGWRSHSLSRLNSQSSQAPHPDFAAQLEYGRRDSGCGRRFPSAQGIPVDCRAIKSRIVFGIDNVFGGNSSQRLLKINQFRMARHFFSASHGNASGVLQRDQIPVCHSQFLQRPISRAKDAFPPFQQTIKTCQLLPGWFERLSAFIAAWIFLQTQCFPERRASLFYRKTSRRTVSNAQFTTGA